MRGLAVLCAIAATAMWLVAGAAPATAHEERTIGRYHVAVGFGEEPAYAGQENSVQILISDARGRPVTDLGPTLKVEVRFGNQAMPPMTLEPNFEVGEFGTPGDYRAFFFPTRPGDYTFHFVGTIKGQRVDESFTSGPATFSSVQDPTAVEFPAQDPTTGQLAQRLDREVQRLRSFARTEARAAADRANAARTLGAIGIAVGVVGVAVGAAGLLAPRRRGMPAASAPAPAGTKQG